MNTEFEAKSEGEVRRVAELLGYNWEEAIFTSCLELYMNQHNLSREEVIEIFKDWRFKDN